MTEKKRLKNVGDTAEQKVNMPDGSQKTITSKVTGKPGSPKKIPKDQLPK